MRAIRFLMIAAACSLFAQINDLATNSDGSVLYFSTSLRQKNTDQRHHPKIYRWSETGGLDLFAWREREFPTHSGTNPYRLIEPFVSTDGSKVGYYAATDCFPTSFGPVHCTDTPPEPLGAQLRPDGTPLLERPGRPRFSPNGRFGAFQSRPGTLGTYCTFLDLEAGTELPCPSGAIAQQVLDDGSVVQWNSWKSRTELWRPGGEPIPLSVSGFSVLNPSGTVAIDSKDSKIFARDLATNRDTLLFASALPLSVRFTPDGSTIFAAGPNPGELIRVQIDGSDPNIYSFPDGPITSFAIAAEGRLAYVSFSNARLVRLDTATGATTELLPPSPNIRQVDGAVSPGTLLRIRGGGFPELSPPAAPFPVEYQGVSVDFGLTRGRVVSIRSNEIAAQVSWSAPTITCTEFPDPFLFQLRVWTPNDGPWDAPEVWLRNCAPIVPATPAATHNNGDPITPDNPARPNEIIRIFATGLGPVTTPQEDGVPAPSDPPVLSASPYRCGADQLTPLTLVPGQLGLYTTSLQIPSSANQGYQDCFAGYIPVRP